MPLATVYQYKGNSVADCSLPLATVYQYNGNSVAGCSLCNGLKDLLMTLILLVGNLTNTK